MWLRGTVTWARYPANKCQNSVWHHDNRALTLSSAFYFEIIMDAQEPGKLVHYLASPITVLLDQTQEMCGTIQFTKTLTVLEPHQCFMHSLFHRFLYIILWHLIPCIKSWNHALAIKICNCCCPFIVTPSFPAPLATISLFSISIILSLPKCHKWTPCSTWSFEIGLIYYSAWGL